MGLANVLSNLIEDYFGSGKDLTVSEMKNEIRKSLNELINGKELAREEHDKLMESLHKPLGRNSFSCILEEYKQPKFIEHWNSFKMFAVLVNCLLTEFVNEKDCNLNTLQVVLKVGKNIYSIVVFQ